MIYVSRVEKHVYYYKTVYMALAFYIMPWQSIKLVQSKFGIFQIVFYKMPKKNCQR